MYFIQAKTHKKWSYGEGAESEFTVDRLVNPKSEMEKKLRELIN